MFECCAFTHSLLTIMTSDDRFEMIIFYEVQAKFFYIHVDSITSQILFWVLSYSNLIFFTDFEVDPNEIFEEKNEDFIPLEE